jgi:hypothetical protein
VRTKCGAGRRAARDEVVLREEKAGEKEKVTSGRQVSAQAEAGTLPAAHVTPSTRARTAHGLATREVATC